MNAEVFISYSSKDKVLAGDIKRLLEKHDGIRCFLAHDDIIPGSEWEKEILSNLETCQVFLSLQTDNLTHSYWCQQESGFLLPRKIPVIPIVPDGVGKPVGFHAKYHAFPLKVNDLEKSIDKLVKEFDLKQIISAARRKGTVVVAEVTAEFKTVRRDQDLHEYKFQFGITNKSDKSPEKINAEIMFPAEYVKKRDWNYPHLQGHLIKKDGLEYLNLIFNYKGLSDKNRNELYDRFILPEKTLWVFGQEPPYLMAHLDYFVDHNNFGNIEKYNVEWEVFINGRLAVKDKRPFKSFQEF